MDIPTTYNAISKRYPEELAKFKEKLKKSKARSKNIPLKDREFRFSACLSIEGKSLDQMIQYVASGQREKDAEELSKRTIEQRVTDFVSRTTCWISVYCGRAWMQSEPIPVPKEFHDYYRKQQEENLREEVRVASLTPEEKQKEVDLLLKQLAGPGFVALKIK